MVRAGRARAMQGGAPRSVTLRESKLVGILGALTSHLDLNPILRQRRAVRRTPIRNPGRQR